MLVWYDPEADAMYVSLEYVEGRQFGTPLDDRRILHHDEHERLVGIEFLFAKRGIDFTGIPERERIIEAIHAFREVTADFAAKAAAP